VSKYFEHLTLIGLMSLAVIVTVGTLCVTPIAVLARGGSNHHHGIERFDERDLIGAYVAGTTGTVVPAPGATIGESRAVVGLSRIVADGAGHLTVEIRRNLAGIPGPQPPEPPVFACTYTIEPKRLRDCHLSCALREPGHRD
jgi:hypothetical protein